MASLQDINRLRRMVNDPDHEDVSDSELNDILDRLESDFNLAAAEVWGIKAALYSSMVTVTESGSTRNLSDLSGKALSMQSLYINAANTAIRGRTTIGRISRSA